MRRSLILTCAPVAVVLALAAAAAPSAHAAFPGRNGVIAYLVEHDSVRALSPRGHRVSTLIPRSRRFGDLDDLQFTSGGRLLAFSYEHNPNVWIRSVSRRARPRRMIPKPPGTDFHAVGPLGREDSEPSWSPDGQRSVFTRFTYSKLDPLDPRVGTAIRIYHRGHSELLARDAEAPDWSVNNEIAFAREVPSGGGEWEVRVIRPGHRRSRRLIREDRLEAAPEHDWSPGGNRLVVTGGETSVRGDHLAIISRTGRLLRRLTKDNRCEDSGPVFSPSGNQIAFTREHQEPTEPRCPTTGLVLVRTDGRHLRRLRPRGFGGPARQVFDWQPLPRRR